MNKQHKPLIMPVDCLQFMVRRHFAILSWSDERIEKIGRNFSDYIHENCKPETLKRITPASNQDVIMNMDHPMRQNGFHPALTMHFLNFTQEMEESL